MSAKTTTPQKRARWLVPMLGLCLAAVLAYAWPREHTATPNREVGSDSAASPQPNASSTSRRPHPATSDPNGKRTPVPATDRTRATGNDAEPQGLSGLVVDGAGQAIANVTVHLIESASNDPLLLPLVQRHRHLLTPVATTDTAIDGTFAVGLAFVQNKIYDLLLVSSGHATVRLTGLRILPDTWHDLGALTMVPGTTLRGRVTVKGRPNMPVPQAVVTVAHGGAFADAAMRALPGEQGALVAHVDNFGYYELPNTPTSGIVQVTAIAPGFARVINREVELTDMADVQVDFELPPGKTLAGDVRTITGVAINNARIEAWPTQANQPPLIAFSDTQGAFSLRGLLTGKYTVRVTARGFAKAEQAAAEAGQPVHLVMHPNNRLLVVVRTPSGRISRKYRLGLRRFFPTDLDAPLDAMAITAGRIGAIPAIADQHIRLDGATDHAEIHDVPKGTFVCEVEVQGFAKTLSLPVRFPVAEQPESAAQRIEVTVTSGHRLRGQVLDSRGTPLAQATIKTQPAGTMPDSTLLRVLQAALPKKISERTVQTDGNGFFVLDRLALATYQLQIEHPQGCRRLIRAVDCNQPGESTLPPVRLHAGSLVQGRATVNGRVKGQMKVVLTTPKTVPADRSIRLETVTDGEGRYRFNRRIPPGPYELRTALVGSTKPDSEIFHQLLQLKRSATSFTVPAGQDVVQHDLNLPSAN